jgi:murein DD-endopeptidase MepM/ murein hydrolase activator NlpD
MAKKYFTLIVVPDATAKFRQIKVPYYFTHALIIIGIILLLAVPIVSYLMVRSYQNMTQISTELPKIRKETRDQKFLIERYECDISELRQMISRLKLANKKLMLMAGVDTTASSQITFGGVGGGIDTDELSSIIQETEETMLQKIDHLAKLKETALNQEELSQRLIEFFHDQKTLLASTPSIWPVKGWVTSGFGMRKSPFTGRKTMHAGIDIATRTGTPIMASADGVVSFSGRKGSFGKVLVIDHGYGYNTFYGHCSSLKKKVGDRVKRGDVVAYVGNTGRSTGPHLHYEVRVNGVATNPTKYILDF